MPEPAVATTELHWADCARPAKTVTPAALLPLVRAGLATAPDRADLRLQLAKALFHTDALGELVERFRSAASDAYAEPELLYHLGVSASTTGERELAHAALARAAAGGFAPAHGYLAEALRRLGRDDDALAAALDGLARAPSDFKALGIAVRTLLDRGEAQRVWDLCAELRARGGWGAYVLSAMALAAAAPEQQREVAALADAPYWLAAAQLDVPESFNGALVAELLAHDALAPLPSTKATTGTGRRIDRLQQTGGPHARALIARIRAAVQAYDAAHDPPVGHPMRERRPAAVTLNAWALAVRHDGHEHWHMHPGGWISGVYYAAVPPVGAAAGEHPGEIAFGPFPFGTDRASAAWPRTRIAPRAGTLLLFPSYFAHRTWPTGVAGPRVCVAFDVVAAPENGPRDAAGF